MEHHHEEHHHEGHHHGKPTTITSVNTAFIVGITLNVVFVVVQLIVGLQINSLSLLSDAGHNLLDVSGLALSLLAFRLTKVKSTTKYTYGYKKSSILVSLLNGSILFISIGAIGYESIFRFNTQTPMPGMTIAVVAFVGILINGGSALLFYKDKNRDINVKSAFLHLISDALVSLGIVVGGILIYYTHLYWIDPLISILICGVILFSTWGLLKDSIRLSLDGVPDDVNTEQVVNAAMNIVGVVNFHHLHIWAISTTDNALTGHLVVSKNLSNQEINQIKHHLKHQLEHLNIGHSTIEIELEGESCDDENC